jgi:hypothetical protein
MWELMYAVAGYLESVWHPVVDGSVGIFASATVCK